MSEDNAVSRSESLFELVEDEPPSQQIIELIGAISETPLVPKEGIEPRQTLPPLHSAVDPDALDALVDSLAEGAQTNARITFSYHGHTVTVRADQPSPVVHLHPASAQADPSHSLSADD